VRRDHLTKSGNPCRDWISGFDLLSRQEQCFGPGPTYRNDLHPLGGVVAACGQVEDDLASLDAKKMMSRPFDPLIDAADREKVDMTGDNLHHVPMMVEALRTTAIKNHAL
jgi:hypothetical protein